MKLNNNKRVDTVQITIEGLVQGVGFRPFIAKTATREGIRGTVCNSSGTVIIMAQGSKKAMDSFLSCILNEKPLGSVIEAMKTRDFIHKAFFDFTIVESMENKEDEIILPADLAVCDLCVEELFQIGNPRYRYAFISCVSCGARYSIIQSVPYDRERTTMDSFQMCDFCKREYSNDTRREYAQTISCHHCGPQLLFYSTEQQDANQLNGEEAFQTAVSLLKSGSILAVKSIGGYNYICRMDSPSAVRNLRKLKARENKPFAIMFRDIHMIRKYAYVSEQEEQLLLSVQRPIVLLQRKNDYFEWSGGADDEGGEEIGGEKDVKSDQPNDVNTDEQIDVTMIGAINAEIYKGSRYVGAFLPYTPLHHLLLQELDCLIVTSANLTDMPIIIDDDQMLQNVPFEIAGILYNKREIVTPLDDSVLCASTGATQFIRRSRGYVPLPIDFNNRSNQMIVATGGDLKAAFCIVKNKKAYMSQYLGDLESYDVMQTYEKAYKHMTGLFHVQPSVVVVDKHPRYHSREFGTKLGLQPIELQHHLAHVYSVMAEYDLKETIGVAFDGTGYGDDGNTWGGEFFVVKGSNSKRAGHLTYTKICGGDRSSKDAGLLKDCYLYAMECGDQFGEQIGDQIIDEIHPFIKSALKHNINTQYTSSMGRLYDVVCALLDINNYNSYEGECAILLENCAYEALKIEEKPYPLQFTLEQQEDGYNIEIISLLKAIRKARLAGTSKSSIALGFHYAISDMILKVSQLIRAEEKINTVSLSGGVFVNQILLKRTITLLEKNKFVVYINTKVPCNDGGIALGQAYYAVIKQEETIGL